MADEIHLNGGDHWLQRAKTGLVNQVFLMFQPNLYASNFLQYYENTFHIILKTKDSDFGKLHDCMSLSIGIVLFGAVFI